MVYNEISYNLAFHRFQRFISQVIFYKCINSFTNPTTQDEVLQHILDHIGLTRNNARAR
jgi:hypothetical protein